MADCIKLQVLDAFADAVARCTRIKSVTLTPSTPVDRDVTQLPAAFVFDEQETVEVRNRLEVGRFRVTVQVYREGMGFRRELENDRVGVKEAIYDDMQRTTAGSLGELHVRAREVDSDIQELELEADANGQPTVGVGRVVVGYEVVYLTKYRDPFAQAGY